MIKRHVERTFWRQRQGTSVDVSDQVADVHRSKIAVRNLAAMGFDAEFSTNGAHVQTVGRRWKLEQRRGPLF